ncbi:MAG: glyoxylase-like metal-dependent hydrolase (beta-lactamase superfamily II) [Myxococcota bacterium]|jgi:glyoxylase-like metal-dependent hydrolase (beta-lactamase superfamily II)
MRKVSGCLHLASHAVISNVWLFEDQTGRRYLVDTGHPLERPQLVAQLRRHGIAGPGDLAGILLTHRHSDHAGNAAAFRERFRCPVICHEADAAFLTGEATPPKMVVPGRPWAALPLCHIEDRWPARTAVDDTFAAGVWGGDWRIHHVPGHTEGSCMLFHTPTATLFSGDAILAGIPPLRAFTYIRLAQDAFSQDAPRCHDGVRRFVATMPAVRALCSGHGPGVVTRVEERLRRL